MPQKPDDKKPAPVDVKKIQDLLKNKLGVGACTLCDCPGSDEPMIDFTCGRKGCNHAWYRHL